MGPAYFKLEKYQKAIDTFKKVIEIKPDFHKAYSGMGMTYRKLKKYQKAIDAYKNLMFPNEISAFCCSSLFSIYINTLTTEKTKRNVLAQPLIECFRSSKTFCRSSKTFCLKS
jgi:tetratricopeptide (TPR) repeat protein